MKSAERVAFAEKHLHVAGGYKFSLRGREWVRDEFWAALGGFKLWPVDKDHACIECMASAGDIVDSIYESDYSRSAQHKQEADGCRGLYSHVIWLVLLQLARQSGKTANAGAFAVSEMLTRPRARIGFIAGSEQQSEKLFRENFVLPSKESKKVSGAIEIMRTRMEYPKIDSQFEIFPTSLAGASGGSLNIVIVDEARDVPPKIFAAFIPQLNARNGWRCPSSGKGHSFSNGDLMLFNRSAVNPQDPKYGTSCTVCGEKLEPWTGRACVMSSAQELDGSDSDWFHDLCTIAESEPQPDTHAYVSSECINPAINKEFVDRSRSVLGAVDGLSSFMDIEAGGVSRMKGEKFLTPSEITACENRDLRNRDRGSRPAVAFLDTSSTVELTSLVIFEDSSLAGEDSWHRIEMARLDVWDPKTTVDKVIDEVAVRKHLDWIVPRFGIVKLHIDDRARPWAIKLVKALQTHATYRSVVEGCAKWNRSERRMAWAKTEERYRARTITVFPDPDLRKEMKGARRFVDADQNVDVHESKRRVRHLDRAEGVASCCFIVHELTMTPDKRGLHETVPEQSGGAMSMLESMRNRAISPRVGEQY